MLEKLDLYFMRKHLLPMIRIQVGLLPVFLHKFVTELWPLIDVFAA